MKPLKKLISVFCCVIVLVSIIGSCTQGAALALSDVDFTIRVDTDTQYIQENTINVDIEIKTQTENGYVDLDLFLSYDTDALSCSTIINNVDGFTTREDRDGADTGLVIEYRSPDGTRAKIDTKVLKLQLVVRTGAATNNYVLSLKAVSVLGIDKDGNKESGLLTVSNAKDKTLNIVAVEGGGDGDTGDGSDPNYYFTTTTASQEVQNGGSGGKTSVGTVLLFIFGAIVIFGAGLVVGFIACQKRLIDEQLGIKGAELRDDSRQRSVPLTGRRGGFGSAFSFGGDAAATRSGSRTATIYDEDEDAPQEEPGFDARTPKGFANWKQPEPDAAVDSGYFGKAAEKHIGASVSSVYDDDSEDDYFPRRGISKSGSDDFQGYGTALGGKRRERGDDGYGGFGGSRNGGYSSAGSDDYSSGREVDSYFGGASQSKDRDAEYISRPSAKPTGRSGNYASSSKTVDGYFGAGANSKQPAGEKYSAPASVTGFSGDDDESETGGTPEINRSDRRRYR